MKPLFRALALGVLVAAATPALAEAQSTKVPAGTYTLVVDSGAVLNAPIASITLVFTDSVLTANVDGQMVIRSRLSMKDDNLVMTDFEGEMACAMPATYKVELNPKGVRLTPLEDMCEGRSTVLAAVTLVKM